MPRGKYDRSGRRALTRARLLEAAARVYARRGFDGATLDEVASEAGLTKGAVYDHFGSKDNLLLALLEEHVSAQIAEQIALFDPTNDTAARLARGADRWMKELDEDPGAFRLFVEAWVQAQRDEGFRQRLAAGMQAWRETFTTFGKRRIEHVGVEASDGAVEQVANALLALGIGLGIARLIEPDSVPPELLGVASGVLIGALESSPEARELLASWSIDFRK